MKKIFTLIIFILLLIPIFQFKTHLIPREKLAGLSLMDKKPELNVSNFISGNYQREFEKFFLERSGVYELLTIINNSINYFVFNVPSGQNSTIVLGKNAIFEKMHLDDYNGQLDSEIGIVPRLYKVKKLQDYLESKGKPFVIVIHPNKYYANKNWQSDFFSVRKPGKRRLEFIKPLLDKIGINYIQLSKELDPTVHFPSSGAHLKYFSKCKATKIVADYINLKYPNFLPEFDCLDTKQKIDLQGEELDLARLLNISDHEKGWEKVEEYELKIKVPAKPKKLLIVGTSFTFGLKNIFIKSLALDSLDLLFYENRYWKFRGLQNKKPGKRIKQQTPDLYTKEFLDQQDFVILEITEHRMSEVGYRLIENINL